MWLHNDDKAIVSNDGVVIDTFSDGAFPVYVEYGSDGIPTSIHIDLPNPATHFANLS